MTMTAQPTPAVVVPMDDDMANEPARTIGQQFANASFVKTLVGAGVTILGIVAPHLASGIDANEANAISLVVLLIASAIASYRARSVPKQQAAETREAVYSPSTVADIVQSEQPAKDVEAVVMPAPNPPAQV